MRFLFPALVLALALSACGQDPPGAASAEDGAVKAADLCVSSDCGEAIEIADIPDAENIFFTDEGRLFVTGGQAVYEITRDAAGAFVATVVSAEACNFTGMAVREGYLYASCSGGFFFGGKLQPTVSLQKIYTFDGLCIPNGTALGPDGRIYVVDEPLTCAEADPKIVALTIDPADPLKVTKQEVWIQGAPTGGLFLGVDTTFRFPNGLVRDGNIFYGTDGGSVYSVSVSDSGAAGEVIPLFFEPTAHDDLALAGDDGLLVCDFFKGRLVLLDRASGDILQETLPGTFVEPSSVRLGQPPLFAPTDILVTDKGVIGETSLPIDKLYVFRRKS